MDMFQMHQQQINDQHIVDSFVNQQLLQQQQQQLIQQQQQQQQLIQQQQQQQQLIQQQQQLQNNHADCSITSEQPIPHDWREDFMARARAMEAKYNEEVAKFGNLDNINSIEDVRAYFDR